MTAAPEARCVVWDIRPRCLRAAGSGWHDCVAAAAPWAATRQHAEHAKRPRRSTRTATPAIAQNGASACSTPRLARCRVAASCMLICMHSTSVRIDASTHEDLKRLATELKTTVGNTVSLAVRALRQDRVGDDLHNSLRDDEAAWLDADLG